MAKFEAGNVLMNDPQVRIALSARFGSKPISCVTGDNPNLDVHIYQVDCPPYGNDEFINIEFEHYPGGAVSVSKVYKSTKNQVENYTFSELANQLKARYLDKHFQTDEFLLSINRKFYSEKSHDEFMQTEFPIQSVFDWYELFEIFTNQKPIPDYMLVSNPGDGKIFRVLSLISGSELKTKSFRSDYFTLLSVENE